EIFLEAMREAAIDVKVSAESKAREALEKLRSDLIKPDLVFLDLNMPVMNVEQFLAEIKQAPQLKDLPVIIYSTTSHPDTIKKVKKMGAFDFVTKPDKFSKLIDILKRILS